MGDYRLLMEKIERYDGIIPGNFDNCLDYPIILTRKSKFYQQKLRKNIQMCKMYQLIAIIYLKNHKYMEI